MFLLGLAGLALLGCGTATDSPAAQPPAAPTNDQATIIAVAAIARVTADNSFGGAQPFDRLNIIDHFGSPSPDNYFFVPPDSHAIDAEVRTAIEHALAPVAITWVASLQAVIGSGPEIPDADGVGAVLMIEPPVVDGTTASITTSLWCGGACGTGGAHALEWTEGAGWVVTGLEGPQWTA
ncbi:MAG: hypothetical protein JWN99_2022 [Ilumatobacteraceae bacterium]|nr:hypothetical protein [Ilumatobacteraceae bacterium]